MLICIVNINHEHLCRSHDGHDGHPGVHTEHKSFEDLQMEECLGNTAYCWMRCLEITKTCGAQVTKTTGRVRISELCQLLSRKTIEHGCYIGILAIVVKRQEELKYIFTRVEAPDPLIFCPPDPDPTCNNGFIKLFSS